MVVGVKATFRLFDVTKTLRRHLHLSLFLEKESVVEMCFLVRKSVIFHVCRAINLLASKPYVTN